MLRFTYLKLIAHGFNGFKLVYTDFFICVVKFARRFSRFSRFFLSNFVSKKKHADLADSFYQPCTKKPAKTSLNLFNRWAKPLNLCPFEPLPLFSKPISLKQTSQTKKRYEN